MKSFLFVNPRSGRYAQQRINSVIQQLKENGLEPTVYSVTTPADAVPFCLAINTSVDPPLVIIAAGDGTINAVVNGLQPGAATLAVLPLGTSNVLAAELGISSIEDGIRRIVVGRTRSLSVGILEMDHSCHRFVLMAGFGLDGTVVRDIWPLGKRLLRQGAYALSALLSTLNWDHSMITVITAEQKLECHSMIVCNASRYGGDFVIAPNSTLYTPEFTAICIRKKQRRTYLRLAVEMLLGRSDMSSEMLRIPVDGIEIRGTKPIQIDGDFVGYSPAKLKTMVDFAQIIV